MKNLKSVRLRNNSIEMGTAAKTVLLVEDDPNISKGIAFNLNLENFRCEWRSTLAAARAFLSEQPADLILLDVGLPDGGGIDFCRELRGARISCPIIMLTAQVDEDSVVAGFEAGATDYVKKPFSNKELMARVKANTQAFSGTKEIVEFHGLTIDLENRAAFFNGEDLELNRRQLDIIYYFAVNQKRVVTREALLAFLGRDGDVLDRTVDAHVSQIRRKLKSLKIETIKIKPVYGIGYRLENAT